MQNVNIKLYKDESAIINDAYDRIVSKIMISKQKSGSGLFTVSGCDPNVGATTTAINIAISLADANWKTLFVDSDIRKGSDSKRLAQSTQYGLSDLLSGETGLEETLCATNIENLHYLPCGNLTSRSMPLISSETFDNVLGTLDKLYDYIIFDSPSLNTTADAAIIASKTAGTILVAGYMQTKTSHIKQAKIELDQLDAHLVGIILNSVPKKDYRRYVSNFDYFIKNPFIKKASGRKKRATPRGNIEE